MGTLANSEDPHEMPLDENNLQRDLKTVTCDPSIYTKNHVSHQKEEARVKITEKTAVQVFQKLRGIGWILVMRIKGG